MANEECDHEWKFNGGNVMCWLCGTYKYPDETRFVAPVRLEESSNGKSS